MKRRTLLGALCCTVLFSVCFLSAHSQCCKLPDSLKVLPVTNASITFSWHASDSIPCDSIIGGYVHWRKVGSTASYVGKLVNYTSGTITVQVDTLQPCTQYQWGVKTRCKHGDSTYYSDYVVGPNFNTFCDTPTCCKEPDSLQVIAITDTAVTFKWHSANAAPCDSIIGGFVHWRKVGSTASYVGKLATYTGGTITVRIDTLQPCTQYQWGVKTRCKHGDTTYYSAYVVGANFTTACDTGHLIKTNMPVKVSPNPAHGSVMLSVGIEKENTVSISVSDIYGNQRILKQVRLTSGTTQTPIDVSRLPKGTYFITVINGKTISKTTFVKAEWKLRMYG